MIVERILLITLSASETFLTDVNYFIMINYCESLKQEPEVLLTTLHWGFEAVQF